MFAAGVAVALAGAAPGGAQLPIPIPTTPTSTSSAPPPPAVAPGPLPDETTAVGADASRRSAVTGVGISPPLRLAWRADMPGRIWGPVTGGGHVFVSSGIGGDNYGAQVIALDQATGARQWVATIHQSYFSVALTYAQGLVFATDQEHVVHAFDAGTGAERWEAKYGGDGSSGPIVAGGIVYTQGQQVNALDAATGRLVWSGGIGDGSSGEPAIAGDRLYVSGGCSVGALNRLTGAVIWNKRSACSGGGGGRVILQGDRVYPHAHDSASVVRSGDGATLGGSSADLIAGDLGILTSPFRAFRISDDAPLWTKTAAGDNLPLVVGNLLVQAGGSERFRTDPLLRVSDVRTGRTLQSVLLPSPAHSDYDHVGGLEPVVAAAPGLVLVSSDATIYALRPGRSAAASVQQPRPLTVTGGRVRLAGRTVGLVPSRLGAQQNRFPFKRGYRPLGAAHALHADGRFVLSPKVDRDTLLRVVDPGGSSRPSRPIAIAVFPRIHLGIGRTGNDIRARVVVTAAPEVRVSGRRAVLYLYRARRHRAYRLGAGALHGPARRVGRTTIHFGALTGTGPRDSLLVCVPGIERAGMGVRDVVQRRCGKPTI